jgi:hypothetical protein
MQLKNTLSVNLQMISSFLLRITTYTPRAYKVLNQNTHDYIQFCLISFSSIDKDFYSTNHES